MSNHSSSTVDPRLVPFYLREAGRQLSRDQQAQVLHSWLGKETLEGCNVVYQWARTNSAEGEFLQWITDAWVAADVMGQKAEEPKNRRRALGLQFRYMLMTTSMVSESSTVPTGNVAMLAQSGSRIQAFELIRQIASEEERLDALFRIMEPIGIQLAALKEQNANEEYDGIWQEVWRTITTFQNEINRAKAVAQLARYAPDEHISKLLEYIIKDLPPIVGTSSSPLQIAFGGIAPFLSEEQLLDAFKQIIGANRLWAGTDDYDAVLIDLATNLIRVGNPHTAIELVRKIDKRKNLAVAVANLAGSLSQPLQEGLLKYTQEAIRASDTDTYTSAQIEISRFLSEAELQLLLDQISATPNPEYRADLLVRLIPKLEGKIRTRGLIVFSGACRAMRKMIPTERRQANKIIELIPELSEPDISELMDVFREMTDSEEVARIYEAMRVRFKPDSQNAPEDGHDGHTLGRSNSRSIEPLGTASPNEALRYPPLIDDTEQWVLGICEATLCLPSSALNQVLLNGVLEAARKNLEGRMYDHYVSALLIALVEHGGTPRTLEVLRQINRDDHSQILSSVLVCMARQGNILQAFAATQEVMDLEWRIRTLIQLIPHTTIPIRNELIDVTRREIDGKFTGDKLSLLALLGNSAQEALGPLLDDIVNRILLEVKIGKITPEIWRLLDNDKPDAFVSLLDQELDAIMGLSPFGNEREIQLAKIAHLLPPSLLLKTLNLVKYMTNNKSLMPTYVQRLAESGNLEESFTLALSQKEPESLIHSLYLIFSKLTSSQQEQAIKAIRDAANSITRATRKEYAPALAEAAELLGEEQWYAAAFKACRVWFKEEYVGTLVEMAPHLPIAIQGDSLQTALMTLMDIDDIPAILLKPLKKSLLSALLQLPYETLYAIWTQSLHRLVLRPRKNILPHVDLWAGIALHLGGEEVAKDIFCAHKCQLKQAGG